MANYGTVEAVQGRAGMLLDNLAANPTEAEVTTFLEEVSATLDGYLAGVGHAVPVTAPVAVAALNSAAVDGALVLALQARFQGGENTPPALKDADKRWQMTLAMFAKGKHSAQVALGQATSGQGAGSFHADEAASYVPAVLEPVGAAEFNPNTQPEVYEGMRL